MTPPPRSTNPRVQPLYNGASAERLAAGRQRATTAMARKPATIPRLQNPQLQATRAINRKNWGTAVRTRAVPIQRSYFNRGWIDTRINLFPQRWFYWHRPHPYTWWWRPFVWTSVGTWIVYDWGDPFYYDYGYNIVYDDDAVFVNDEPIATYDDFVQSAEDLANRFSEPPADQETEWMSLGTWMLSTDPNAQDTNMMLQLVLGKENQISGTYLHIDTNATQAVQGSMDPETQRVSFTIGEKTTTILETGLANLSQETAPVWVHFTDQRQTQTWLLVRLEDEGATAKTPPAE